MSEININPDMTNFKKWVAIHRHTPPTEEYEFCVRKKLIDFGLGLEFALLDASVPQDLKDEYISLMFCRHPKGMWWWYPGLFRGKTSYGKEK